MSEEWRVVEWSEVGGRKFRQDGRRRNGGHDWVLATTWTLSTCGRCDPAQACNWVSPRRKGAKVLETTGPGLRVLRLRREGAARRGIDRHLDSRIFVPVPRTRPSTRSIEALARTMVTPFPPAWDL